MAAPPNRTELVDNYPNPSTGVFKAGLGKFFDYARGLLGSTGNPAEARTALGVPAAADAVLTGAPTATTAASTDNSTRIATTAWAKLGFAVSLAIPGYIKFPSWMGGLTVQWGSSVITTDSGGNAAISFPMTFPTSLSTVVLSNGDSGAAGVLLSSFTTGFPTLSAHAVHANVANTGGSATGLTIRVNWVAFGS